MAGLLDNTGYVYGKVREGVNAAYERGQLQQQNAQLLAMRQRQMEDDAQKRLTQDTLAAEASNFAMPEPAFAPGSMDVNRYINPPQAEPARAFNPDNITGAGFGPAPYDKKGKVSSGVVPPPLGFSAPPDARSAPPSLDHGSQMPPYGAHGRGWSQNFGPVSPPTATPSTPTPSGPAPSQSDVRRFEMDNPAPVIKGMPDNSNTPRTTLPADNPGDYVSRAANTYGIDPRVLLAVADQESGLNPNVIHKPNKNGTVDQGLFGINSIHGTYTDPEENAQKGAYIFADAIKRARAITGNKTGPLTYDDYITAYRIYNGGPSGYDSREAFNNASKFGAKLLKHYPELAPNANKITPTPTPNTPVEDTTVGPQSALQPQVGSGMGMLGAAGAPGVAAVPQKPAETPMQGPSSVSTDTVTPNQKFQYSGGVGQNFNMHYDALNKQVASYVKMAQMQHLSGDAAGAQQSLMQANIARAEQYRIAGERSLNAAHRGNPTQLLSMMNFYDPGANYVLQPTNDGNIALSWAGHDPVVMSYQQFVEKARLMTDHAYYSMKQQMYAQIYPEMMKQGFQFQREAGVAAVKGSWDMATKGAENQNKFFQSQTGDVFYTQNGKTYRYVPGNEKNGTQGVWVPIPDQSSFAPAQ